MDLKELQVNWDELGRRDPLWAIITDPQKRDRKWGLNDFFKSGQMHIEQIMGQAQRLGLPFRRGLALDFGCGVGRLTLPLCPYFSHVIGVDIAPSMIELANKYNPHGDKCMYLVNDAPDLNIFEDNSFDFVLSWFTLQHIEPEFSKQYVKEFLRILAPGGLLVFQMPSGLIPPASVSVSVDNNPVGILPDKAFKAEIIPEKTFITAKANSLITLPVKVKNISDVPWPAYEEIDKRFPINLGDHWYHGNELVTLDAERVCLKRGLKPKEEALLTFLDYAPKYPGDYIMELDMVQEGVAWFHNKGSTTIKVRVCVQDNIETNATMTEYPSKVHKEEDTSNKIDHRTENIFVPKIEMFGVPKEKILRLVLENGGELLAAEENLTVAPPWISFIYWVTKRRANGFPRVIYNNTKP